MRADRALTIAELRGVAGLHAAAAEADLRDARRQAVAAAEVTDRRQDVTRIGRALRDWSSRQLAVIGHETGVGIRDRELSAACRLAGPALIDAAVGTFLHDSLPDDAKEILTRPLTALGGAVSEP